MQKWEYTIAITETKTYESLDLGNLFDRTKNNNDDEFESDLDILDEYGSSGWELAGINKIDLIDQIEQTKDNKISAFKIIYYFKRPIEE